MDGISGRRGVARRLHRETICDTSIIQVIINPKGVLVVSEPAVAMSALLIPLILIGLSVSGEKG